MDGEHLVVCFMDDTDRELRFSPDVAAVVDGREHRVSRVSLLVEDPRTAATLLRTRVRSAAVSSH